MFSLITLKNFRAFNEIKFDLTHGKNSAKSLAIVYGENGAGKSNLMSAFVLLKELFNTMNVRDRLEELINQKDIFSDERLNQALKHQLMAGLRDMQAIINDYRMIGSNNHITAEYEFFIAHNAGKYTVEFGESEIVHERLEYTINTRRGVCFDCTDGNLFINNSIVKNRDLLADIKADAKRFWGKHSIFAIITHELQDKSSSFACDNIADNFFDVLGEFQTLSCFIGIGTRQWNKFSTPLSVLGNITDGQISTLEETQLDIIEDTLTRFFHAINSDIKRAYYKRNRNEKMIEYELFFEKLISGEYRNIPFSKESTGNHQLIKTFCYLLTACMGYTVVMDEADSGIHDVLFQKIIKEVAPKIKGQLIMTTHNTLLMEMDVARDATYIVSEIEGGHKVIKCVSAYEKRTYINNNIRNKYLSNDYKGLPTVNSIDIDYLISKIASATNKYLERPSVDNED